MPRYIVFLLLGVPAGLAFAAAPRFTGDMQLRPPEPVSANGRFALTADLKPAVLASASGRFTLHAALRPDAKAIALACGPDFRFSNGFEN